MNERALSAQAAELTREFEGAFGAELAALSLHGQGVALWWPARLVAVLRPEGIASLHRAHALLIRWRKRGLEAPLFLAPADFRRALDAFPLEFFNLKLSCQVLSGADVWAGVRPEPEMLRLQCERELRGKTIVLRRLWAASTLYEEFQELVAASVPLFLGVFRGLLSLGGQAAPLDPPEVIAAAAQAFHVDEGLFTTLAQVAQGEGKRPGREALHALVERYLAQCERLAQAADELSAAGA